MSSMDEPVLLTIEIEDSWFAAGTEQWHRDRENLRNELDRGLGPGAVRQGPAHTGDKGLPLIPIIVALGGARALEVLARCFDSWLKNRPGERILTIKRTVNGKEQTVRIEAQNAPIDVLKQFVPDTAMDAAVAPSGDE